jgi:hypothetical protein
MQFTCYARVLRQLHDRLTTLFQLCDHTCVLELEIVISVIELLVLKCKYRTKDSNESGTAHIAMSQTAFEPQRFQ